MAVACCRSSTWSCLLLRLYNSDWQHCLLRRQMYRPTRLGSWLHAGLSHAFLVQYWASLRGLRRARRITLFFWLLAHAGLAVGTWGALMGHDPLRVRCESQTHCLWSYPTAIAIWRVVALLLSRAGMHTGFLSWGTAS